MMTEDRRRGRGRPSLAAALVTLSCLLTACGGSGGGSEADSAPPRPATSPPTATPPQGTPGSPSATESASSPSTPTPSAHGTASVSPGCVAGSATVVHNPGDASVHALCVRSGTTVTVVLEPRAHGPWPRPRSSNPMLALVTSSATDAKGAARVTLRAARIGAVTVTWGPESAPLFTLRLSVAAYPVQ
ncbi:hypothetical protein ACWEN3_00630 [Streptomyces sp. NPDC004561]